MGHRGEQIRGHCPAITAQELSRPAVDLALWIEILPFDHAQQIRHLVGTIGERAPRRIFLDRKIEGVGRRVIEANETLEAQLRCPAGKAGNRHAIAKHVVHPADIGRFRSDREPGVEQLLIVAVARPQHHAVLAEGNRLLVAVDGKVPNGDDAHRLPIAALLSAPLRLRANRRRRRARDHA